MVKININNETKISLIEAALTLSKTTKELEKVIKDNSLEVETLKGDSLKEAKNIVAENNLVNSNGETYITPRAKVLKLLSEPEFEKLKSLIETTAAIQPKEIIQKPKRNKKAEEAKIETFAASVILGIANGTVKVSDVNKKERVQVALIKGAMKKAKAYKIKEEVAAWLIQEAIVKGMTPDEALLSYLKAENGSVEDKEWNKIHTSIIVIAMEHFNGDVSVAYEKFSEEMIPLIGKNMSARRARHTKTNPPSYREMITEYNAFKEARKAIKSLNEKLAANEGSSTSVETEV